MKKNIIATIALFAVLTSCSLDRSPLTGPSSATFPASEKEALSGTLSAYKAMANAVQQYEPYPSRWQDMLTDIGTLRTVLSGWPNYTKSTITAETSQVASVYSNSYKTLGRIHMVLDKYDQLKDKMDEQTFNQYKAELLAQRAFVYDRLCQLYGDVPWVDHCLTLEDCSYPRVARDTIIKRVLKDLDDDLIDALPIQWNYSDWGTCRFGRVAVYMLKARMLLEWGWPAEAAVYSRKALDLAEGVYGLTPLDTHFYETHSDGEPCPQPLFGFEGESNSEEWIFAAQYNRLAASNTHAGIYTFASRVHNGAAAAAPSMSLVDSFQDKDGKAISDPSSCYDWTSPWKNRDPRLDLYLVRPKSRCMGVEYCPSSSSSTVWDYNISAFVQNKDVAGNKHEYGPNGIQGPGSVCLWRKYTDKTYYGNITGTGYEDELDAVMMRYAELLLIDAEANIEGDGDLSRAADDINTVRARVDMPAVVATDKASLRTALRYERKVELCNEGFRWFDIRRWADDGLVFKEGKARAGVVPVAKKALEEGADCAQHAPAYDALTCNAKPTIDASWTVTYDGSTFDGKASTARLHDSKTFNVGKDELWPMPYKELISNPALDPVKDQNPGY